MWWWTPALAADAETEPADEAIEEIEEIVVTGTRTRRARGDSPVATQVIDREAIERSGAVSVADLLDRVTGVQVDRGAFGSALSLQGTNPDHTLVLIDGQRMVGRKEGVLDLTRIDVDRIERIEIVKGPGSTLYGSDAIGGVISIITREPQGARATAEVRYGELQTLDTTTSLDLTGGPVGSTTSLSFHSADAYDQEPANPATDGVAYDLLQGAQKLVFDLSDDDELTASASYLARYTTAVEEQEVSNARFDRNNALEELQASASNRLVASETSTLTTTWWTTVFRDQFFYDQAGSNQLDQYEDNRQTLSQLQVQLDQVLGPHVLSVGAEGFQEWYASPRLETEDGRGQRQRGAVFVQDEWSLFRKRVTALPGFRLDADSQFGLAPAPRLGLAWFASEVLTFRGNAGFGFRAPDFKELYVVFANPAAGYVAEGNPELRPERSFGVTLAGDLDLDEVRIEVQGFRNELVDLIDYQLDTSGGFSATQTFRLQNVARARTQGVDGSLAVRPVEALTVRGGGQLLESRNLTPDDPAEGLPLQNRAPVSATFGMALTERASGLTFTVDGTWNGERAIYEDDGAGGFDLGRADALVLLDSRLQWDAGDGARLYVGVENLLDGGDDQYNQVRPRWVYAGLRGTFAARREGR